MTDRATNMHPSRTPIRSLVDVVKWLELRQSFYIWYNKPRFMHHGWLQNMTIPTIRGLVASGAIYRALSDEKDKKPTDETFEDAMAAIGPVTLDDNAPKPARAPRPHWTARPYPQLLPPPRST